MSIFTKSMTIAFTILALGVAAEAQNNGGGKGGGGNAGSGGDGETGIMSVSPNQGPITHVQQPNGRRNTNVRIIAMQPCADGNAVMNKAVCRPITP